MTSLLYVSVRCQEMMSSTWAQHQWMKLMHQRESEVNHNTTSFEKDENATVSDFLCSASLNPISPIIFFSFF